MRKKWVGLGGALVLLGLGVFVGRSFVNARARSTAVRSSNEAGEAGPRREHRALLAEAAITRMDLDDAERLLGQASGPEVSRARARLSIYRADCEGAVAQLESSGARSAEGAAGLAEFAARCAGATVNGYVVSDEARGIWIRFQDRADEVLAPLLFQTIEESRRVIEADLGAVLPRPLRVDLVRDLFSLSAVSGLPLEAAETTGTVAVARWGRVTMISPRAMTRGYSWQDTMAHEITHLVLSRATADRAPLWLQEGVAKREETRWRARRAFDRDPEPSVVAHRAEQSGRSVGVDKLGPSIAMLPSADAAGIAFAEVTSFVEYWLEVNGSAALPALLRDVRVASDTEQALRSVSGLGLVDWQVLWRHDLRERYAAPDSSSAESEVRTELPPREMARVQRLVELLFVEGHPAAARQRGAPELDRAPHSAALGFLVGRAALAAQEEDSLALLRPLSSLDGAHGGFLALLGHGLASGQALPEVTIGDPVSVSTTPELRAESRESSNPEELFVHALALDPLLPEVACEGIPWYRGASLQGAALPSSADRARLCEHTRSLPIRGAQ